MVELIGVFGHVGFFVALGRRVERLRSREENQVQSRPGDRRAPIQESGIRMTDEDRHRAQHAGFDDHLTKPVRPDNLKALPADADLP